MTVLAIETSCDETAAAVFRGGTLLAGEISSQIAVHAEFGGVVPEVASRNHLRMLRPVVDAALAKAGVKLAEIDVFAATRGPGLATSLMIGFSAAKGMALGFGRRFVAVNHIEAHLLSPFYGRGGIRPAVGLVVSGGHTLLVEIESVGNYRLLGRTEDDAAGEAFDKVGKLLGLPYPGGPNVDRLATSGDSARFKFPRSMLSSGDFAFSFSGLKTSVRYLVQKSADVLVADVCASFQEAVVDVLVEKTVRAATKTRRRTVALSGGVSCNSRLRARMRSECERHGLELLLAEPMLCTDNAAMIAFVATLRVADTATNDLALDIDPNLPLDAKPVVTPGGDQNSRARR